MKLSIIIPCFNEEKTIEEIVLKVKKNIDQNDEIIIIDDCSTDQTRSVLNNQLSDNKII